MKDLIAKLSSYKIFNYLFPGILFVGLAEKFTSFSFIHDNLLIGLPRYYFIGMLLSRIGSLLVESPLRWTKFIQFADYEEYVAASELDSQIALFSDENNTYRTLCSLFIVLIFLKIYDEIKGILAWSADALGFILLFGFGGLLLFAYRKQTRFVVRRIKIALEKKQE